MSQIRLNNKWYYEQVRSKAAATDEQASSAAQESLPVRQTHELDVAGLKKSHQQELEVCSSPACNIETLNAG
jgi:hypothetical protein